MNIQVTTETLDEIAYKLKIISGNIYELYSAVHSTYSELDQDQSLAMFPGTYLAVESLGKSAGTLRKVAEDAESLARVISTVPESLISREKALEEQISSISSNLEILSANASGILLPNYCLGSAFSAEEASECSLDDLLGIAKRSVEVSNLSAIAVVIDKEYGDNN